MPEIRTRVSTHEPRESFLVSRCYVNCEKTLQLSLKLPPALTAKVPCSVALGRTSTSDVRCVPPDLKQFFAGRCSPIAFTLLPTIQLSATVYVKKPNKWPLEPARFWQGCELKNNISHSSVCVKLACSNTQKCYPPGPPSAEVDCACNSALPDPMDSFLACGDWLQPSGRKLTNKENFPRGRKGRKLLLLNDLRHDSIILNAIGSGAAFPVNPANSG